jgi:aerobic carbon-monoxide dehydrogenase medium subunit
MITRHFTYLTPSSADEAASMLSEGGDDTEIIGGGTWVVPEMTNGTRRPSRVIDLARAGLRGVAEDEGEIVLGAQTTYRDLIDSDLVAERLPLLRTLALGITGGSQIWNRGTIGGSACYANPQSDVPASLVALAATMRLRSAAGVRNIAAGEFFRGAFAADVRDGELLEAIAIQRDAGRRGGYYKFKLSESSWPIVTAAFVDDGRPRVALGGVEAAPLLVELDAGTDAATVTAAVEARITAPHTDTLASGDYKRSIAGVIASRAVDAAQAQNGAPR